MTEAEDVIRQEVELLERMKNSRLRYEDGLKDGKCLGRAQGIAIGIIVSMVAVSFVMMITDWPWISAYVRGVLS